MGYSDANPLKHVDHTNQAWGVHVVLDVHLGDRIGLHSVSTELWRIGGVPILLGGDRGWSCKMRATLRC